MSTFQIAGAAVGIALLVPITIGFVWSLRAYLRMKKALKNQERKP